MTKISPVNVFSSKHMNEIIGKANREMSRNDFKTAYRLLPEPEIKKPLLDKIVDFAKNNKKLMAIGAAVLAGVAAVTAVVVKAVQNHKQDK